VNTNLGVRKSSKFYLDTHTEPEGKNIPFSVWGAAVISSFERGKRKKKFSFPRESGGGGVVVRFGNLQYLSAGVLNILQ
jgi:hypothetical protein